MALTATVLATINFLVMLLSLGYGFFTVRKETKIDHVFFVWQMRAFTAMNFVFSS